MFSLIKKDVKQIVKATKPRRDITEVKDAAISNREEINKMKEEIEAINRTIEIEKKRSFRKDFFNKILIIVNLVLVTAVYFLLLKK